MNALRTTFPVTLRFVSDWHVGTGEDRVGVVDALIRRDADKLPFVPAKTLLGVWRDAAETVAHTLDDGERGRWAAWVDWLFGSQPSEKNDATADRQEAPARAALSLTPARLPVALREAVRGKQALVEATALLRPGVMLDSVTGTAEEDFLRLEERALGGLLLEAQATVSTDDGAVPAQAELLLRAGARLMDALGGKRNRGTGRLVLRVDGAVDASVVADPRTPAPPDERLAALLADDALLADPGTPPDGPGPDAPLLTDVRTDTRRRRWRLELEALSPVVIVDRVVGNNITTRDEIPGTTLLPVILTALPDPDAVGLHDVRVGNAVPAVLGPDGTAYPAPTEPMVWHRTDKGQGDTVINAARENLDPTKRPKPARRRAARLPGDGTEPRWRQCSPGTSVSTHATVNDAERRPTADAGGLFSYHGIEPGTILVSDLVLPDGVSLNLAVDDIRKVGRSRKDDFGRVRVRGLTPLDDAPPRRVGADGVLRVWLLSDVLLRDERLAYDASPQRLATVLGDALGVPPDVPLVVVDRDPRLRPTMTQAVRRDGFTPRWGRPRSSQVGLKAGSVITFRLPDGVAPDPARVAEVERDGIGDRTVEGFGRLVIDPPELLTTQPEVEPPPRGRNMPDDSGSAVAAASLPDVSPHEPHPIELAAWRREIRREVAAIAADPDRQRATLPGLQKTSRAQRGVLRGQVDRLARPDGARLVEDWFATLARSVTRRDAWPPQTRAMLRDLLLTDQVWTALGLGSDQADLVLAPGRERLLRAALRHEALAVLVDELVRQAQADEETPTRQEVRS